MGDILEDSRFTKYLNDPRYRQIPKSEQKVKIDKRFQSMFKDEKFKVKYTVDKRGRPVNETSTENLRKYYDLESGDEKSASGDNEDNITSIESEVVPSKAGQFVRKPQSDNEIEDFNEDFIKNDKLVRGKLDKKTAKRLKDLETDYARGEGILLTDSSSDEESSEEDEDSELEHRWGELDADAETTDDSTRRIAVCHMDWDNITAKDIMVLFNSFLPPGGVIKKVSIYPSEYGLQRMKEEEIRGPLELTETKVEDNFSGGEENEEGSSYHMEKLRRYQLNRLKYYYAVVECDTVATADKIYAECDGMQYESSSTKLDLRFVPDDVTFDEEPREVCTKLPDLRKYKPRLFTTTALQQVKVDLTWDTTNPNRTDAIKSALGGKIDDLDIKEYLASSSSEQEDEELEKAVTVDQSDHEEDDPIEKYKNLLKEIEEKEDKKKNKDMEMEITWGIGVKEKAEELVKKKAANESKDLTPFEKLLEKRKEKKKQKKLERQKQIEKLKAQDSLEDQSQQSDDEIPSDIDMNDPYFAEEFNKPEFKKKDKQKKYKHVKESEDEEDIKRKAELELLLDDDDGKQHFSLKKIQAAENESKKAKRKKKIKEKMLENKNKSDDFEVNVNDTRFSALFESHHFNIDPADSNFKKTKNMDKLIQEKLKRRPKEVEATEPKQKISKQDAELSLLVKNIKMKTKNVVK